MKLAWTKIRQDALIVLALLLIAFLPMSRVILTPGQILYHGDIDLFYMLDIPVQQAYANGEWPLWNVYAGTGAPALGDPQSAAVYPMRFLFQALPREAFFEWGALLHVWLAGVGMYVLLRDFQTRRAAAVLGAISYMLSSAIFPRFIGGHPIYVYAATWPAWLLLCYRRLLNGSLGYFAPTALLATVQVLTGHLPYVMITLIVHVVYGIYHAIMLLLAKAYRKLGYAALVSAVVGVTSIGLAAIQLLPAVEWFELIMRGQGMSLSDASVQSFRIEHLPTFAMPFLWYEPGSGIEIGFGHYWEVSPFVGAIPLLLAVIALSSRESNPIKWYFAAIALLGISIAFKGSPLFQLIYGVMPFFRVPGRYLFLWMIAISALSGLGFDALLREIERSRGELYTGKVVLRWLPVALFGAVILLAIWWIGGDRIVEYVQHRGLFYWMDSPAMHWAQLRNLIMLSLTLALACGAFAVLASGRFSLTWRTWVVPAAVLIEMMVFAAVVIRPYPVTALYDPESPLARLNGSAEELRLRGWRAPPNYGFPTVDFRSDGGYLRTFEAVRALGMREGQRGAQILSAAYEVSGEPLSEERLREIEAGEGVYLYEYEGNWPRIYAAPEIEVVADDSEALGLITNPAFDLYQTVVITGSQVPDLPAEHVGREQFEAEYTEYNLNDFTAHVETDRPVMIVFNETYYPGWNAWVNGEPVPIYQANYAFRGVMVPAGEHTVVMKYQPASFRRGLWITGVTLALFTLAAGGWWLRGRREADES